MGWRIAILAAVASLQLGCYNYAPLRRSELVPATYLAVMLTETGSDELAPYIGPNVLVVRGRFLSATDRGLNLSVEGVENKRGDVLEWRGETVMVPAEFVRSLEERHGAAGKTVLLAGASLAGFFVAYAAFGPGASGTASGGVGGGPSPR
jgi:hypothetical protein